MILFKLIEELKSEKYVFIFICIFIILIYHVYKNICSCKNNIEKMTPISDDRIAEAVKQYYLSDNFLKTMASTSIKIQTEGLKFDGNISVNGNIKANNEITNNQFSLSGTNTSINNAIESKQREQDNLRRQQLAEAEQRRQQEQQAAEQRRQQEQQAAEQRRQQEQAARQAAEQREAEQARQTEQLRQAAAARAAHEHWLNTKCGGGSRRADRCSSGCESQRWNSWGAYWCN